MAVINILVPNIGDFDEVGVIELMVKPGDVVTVDQSLIVVESDKASMEIPSSHAGTVQSVQVQVGDKVKEGSVVLTLDVLESATATSQAIAAPAAVMPSPSVTVAPVAAGSVVSVYVPDIGDFKDVSVIEVMVKEGDTIKVEQSLMTVESDKASMEIPSSAAGKIQTLRIKVGDKVNIGDLIAVLETTETASSSPASIVPVVAVVPPPVPVVSTAAPQVAHNPTGVPTAQMPHASPSVRKFARLLGVPLAEVKGSGTKGRITEADVQAFTQAVMNGRLQTTAQMAVAPSSTSSSDGAALGLIPWPKIDFTKFGAVERKDLGRIKKISAANLHRNWVMIPHVTNHDDADITDLEAFRVSTNKANEKSGVKVTMLAFLIKACVAALKKFPDFNASIDGDQLVLKQYFHIGFAADTPNGLVVPVIRDADKKGILQISQEMGELAKKARDGKLSPADMSGACFTISSLGGIGGRYFTPIINAPEVAILGVCKSTMEPVWNGAAFEPRLMLPLSLSWDHRVIDGASAARFTTYLGQILADFRRVLL